MKFQIHGNVSNLAHSLIYPHIQWANEVFIKSLTKKPTVAICNPEMIRIMSGITAFNYFFGWPSLLNVSYYMYSTQTKKVKPRLHVKEMNFNMENFILKRIVTDKDIHCMFKYKCECENIIINDRLQKGMFLFVKKRFLPTLSFFFQSCEAYPLPVCNLLFALSMLYR